jgi:hypothetical protein
MPWHPVASGMCDRNVNAADGVGSWKHEPRTHPAYATGAWCITVPTGTAKMEIPDHWRAPERLVHGLNTQSRSEVRTDRQMQAGLHRK